MDGATNSAGGDLKQVDTRPLAEVELSQHEWWNHERAHVPEPSTPPSEYSRWPTDHPNPPRRRGRIKTRPREASIEKIHSPSHMVASRPYRASRICCICCTGTWNGVGAIPSHDVRRRSQWSRSRPTAHTLELQERLAEPQLAISGNHSSAARRCHLE